MPDMLTWPLLHGIHTGAGAKEWTVAALFVAGYGAILIGRWLARQRRQHVRDDEPI